MNPNLFIVVALVAVVVALFAWAVAKSQNASHVKRPTVGNANRKFFRQHMRKVYLAPLLIQRVFGFLPGQRDPRGAIQFANIGEGTHESGMRSYIPDAATTSRYLLYKIGTDGDHVAVTGAGDVPIGPSDDSADAGVPLSVNILGAKPGTVRVVTDGTIANGDHVKAGASGKATKASTTDVSFGIALIGSDTTVADGDVIAIAHCVPHKYVF